VKLLRESVVVDHAADGAAGLISMFGVRYTTARHTAARAIDLVFARRGAGTAPRAATDRTPVSGGAIDNKESFLRAALLSDVPGVTEPMLRRLALTYGTHYDQVLNLLRVDQALARPLGASCAVTGVEVLYATRHESARRLTDAVIRRTEAGSAGHPGSDAVASAAAIMARELGWDAQTVNAEIERVNAFYRLHS
jgi:glycerol-3-phosphate dehydrogenase